ncbi:hypothetical protein VP1G_10277 [Cytospora mali]|uniref:Conserved oligomeric Golgi complex subunit 1 n=1 Tax=Cytospora mali TaxID=578113 RepID=A0A194VH05_CYTMA|nr:hypothetical protein VP1G_10277 [Valsa mali var. pyri (nom. inval.)]
MASNLPDQDLSTLTSSAQIFSSTGAGSPSYTLPQIRTLHKHIHVAIDDKQARLRTQVGGSYRELLGTADAIVRMRGDMDEAQGILGRMGARCGRAVVGGKAGGLARFVGEGEEGKRGKGLAGVARAKILAGCVLCLGRLLKREGAVEGAAQGGERLMAAAKVLVLGRLLVKSFEEKRPDSDVKAAVEPSVKSLDRLRKRLLRGIDKVLETVGETTNRDLALKALCAYSLATDSGTHDVIRHFLDIRGSAMASVFDVEEHRNTLDVVKGLELYTKTILDVQFLVPNKLTDALASLKKEKLLSDPTLRELEGLRLDIYERWCSEAIQNYKPTIRHDDLDGRQAVDMLTKWSSKGSEVLLQGLEKTLERTTEFKAIMDMRTEVLQLWIRDGGKARGFDPSIMLDKLRKTINTHVMGVLGSKVNKLRLVGSEVAATLEVWQSGVTDIQQSLWDTDSLDMDLHHGAGLFAQDVIARLYGRNDAVSRAVTGYLSWAQVIDDVEEVVEQLKKQRWDNDVDEIEDEETIEQRQQVLSREDPAKLQERLHAALEKAFTELDEQLGKLWDVNKDGEKSGKIAMYLLRILRDIRAKLPKLEAIKGFGLGMVSALQERIVATVALDPVEDFTASVLTRKVVGGRSLWEGEPELPTSPSPGVFRLLRNLTMAMGDAGTDLWSPSAVSALKKFLSKELSERWTKALETDVVDGESKVEDEKPAADAENGGEKEAAKEEENGAEGTEDAAIAEKLRKDLLVQWLFDIAILRCSISTSETADELKKLEEAVWKKTDVEGTSARQRLNKTPQEYWKRSSLLFGLLN